MSRTELSKSDEWETPRDLVHELANKYGVFPVLDAAANADNSKLSYWLDNALNEEWFTDDMGLVDVWCNPPHSKNEQFVRKAFEQWKKHNINIMMILPTNTMSSIYWHDCIEGIAEIHPIKGRIRFLYNGKPAKDVSRNAYVCVIWRKK